MSKENTYNIRIGKKLIPVNKPLYLYYYRSRRRLKYYEHDIKIDIAIRDSNGEIISYKPSKGCSTSDIYQKKNIRLPRDTLPKSTGHYCARLSGIGNSYAPTFMVVL